MIYFFRIIIFYYYNKDGKGLMGIGAVISAQLLISKINLIGIRFG